MADEVNFLIHNKFYETVGDFGPQDTKPDVLDRVSQAANGMNKFFGRPIKKVVIGPRDVKRAENHLILDPLLMLSLLIVGVRVKDGLLKAFAGFSILGVGVFGIIPSLAILGASNSSR